MEFKISFETYPTLLTKEPSAIFIDEEKEYHIVGNKMTIEYVINQLKHFQIGENLKSFKEMGYRNNIPIFSLITSIDL